MTYKVGTRVKGTADWGTIREVRADDGKFKVDWDDGVIGRVWWAPEELQGAEGPVRTVTRREIVPGTYGGVTVGKIFNVPDCNNPYEPPQVQIDIDVRESFTADQLEAAALVLQQLAEALRDQSVS